MKDNITGQLVLDLTNQSKSYNMKHRIYMFIFSLLFIFISMILAFPRIFGLELEDIEYVNVYACFFASVFLVFGLLSLIFSLKGKGKFLIFENGIVIPDRTLKQIILGDENYIPFDKILSITLNAGHDHQSILIRMRKKGFGIVDWYLPKSLISDEEMFIKAIGKKVSVS